MIAELPAMAEAGAWSESNLFLWLKLVLPGFDADCWMSSNKRCGQPSKAYCCLQPKLNNEQVALSAYAALCVPCNVL